MRVGNWNLSGFGGARRRTPLLAKQKLDLLLLQEVRPAAYFLLLRSGLFAWSAYSLSLRHPKPGEQALRGLGCAVFGSDAFRLRTVTLLEDAPFPERTLSVAVDGPTGPLVLGSFHIPPGSRHGIKKQETYEVLAAWMRTRKQRTIVGIDGNAPWTDHPDHNASDDSKQTRWWANGEKLVLGPKPRHAMRDALRVHLEAHPREMARVRKARPSGPLAVSYSRKKRAASSKGSWTQWEARYDHVYVTPDVAVKRVRYLYEDGLKAGSDHALVVAECQLLEHGNDR